MNERGPRKKRFGKKPGFNPERLSPTNKPIASVASLDHLADAIKHAKDVTTARWLREKYILLSLEIEEPAIVAGDPAAADIFGESVTNERDLETAMDDRGVIASIFNISMGYRDGRRQWTEMSGASWIESMKDERKKRGTFRYDNHSKITDRDDLSLECIYLRLPPWVAVTMRKKLLDHREVLVDAMTALGTAFQERFGVDTLGVAVHSESDHDLHAHIVFSQSKEVPKRGYKHKVKERRRLWKALNESVRAELKQSGEPYGNRAVHRKVAEKIDAGKVESPDESAEGFEYIRRREEKTIKQEWLDGRGSAAPILVRGPAYRAKYWVWKEASEEKKEDVILRGESVDWKGGFRQMLREVPEGQTPADVWADIWCEAAWQEEVMRTATPEDEEKIRAYASAMTEQYIESGSTIPSRIQMVADALVSTKKELEQTKKARDQSEKSLTELQVRSAENDGKLRELEARLKSEEEALVKLKKTEQARDRVERHVVELENQASRNDLEIRKLKTRLKLRDEEAALIGGIVGIGDDDADLPDAVARVRGERDYHKGIVAELMEQMNAIMEVLAKLLPRALREQLVKLLPDIFSAESLGLIPSESNQSKNLPSQDSDIT
jgi:hypothetical protein